MRRRVPCAQNKDAKIQAMNSASSEPDDASRAKWPEPLRSSRGHGRRDDGERRARSESVDVTPAGSDATADSATWRKTNGNAAARTSGPAPYRGTQRR